jgi:predicted alpha/beta superfamily hydrolase
MTRIEKSDPIRTGNFFIVLISVYLFSCSGLMGIAQSDTQIDSAKTEFPKVSIPYTELRTLHSEVMDQDFDLYIKLPWSYSGTDMTYPVLYALDANRTFPMVANISHMMDVPRTEVPEILVVGIAYQTESIVDWVIWRNRDFTPTVDPGTEAYWETMLSQATGRDDIDIQTGGGSRFLEFIRQELIPFVESNYRVSATDRGLFGYSKSGVFVLYTLFSHPETFQRYFAGSPSLNYGDRILFQHEEAYAAAHDDLPVKLFMTAGGLESVSMIENMKKMADSLRSRNYPLLELETVLFEDETHSSCVPAAVSRAFQVLYK